MNEDIDVIVDDMDSDEDNSLHRGHQLYKSRSLSPFTQWKIDYACWPLFPRSAEIGLMHEE